MDPNQIQETADYFRYYSYFWYCIGTYALYKFTKAFWQCSGDEREERKQRKTRQALQDYVRTGRKGKAFYTADRSAIASAERARIRYVEEQRREVEKENIDFRAAQVCPKCKYFDIHWLKIREDGKLNGRECRKCGYFWHTVG